MFRTASHIVWGRSPYQVDVSGRAGVFAGVMRCDVAAPGPGLGEIAEPLTLQAGIPVPLTPLSVDLTPAACSEDE